MSDADVEDGDNVDVELESALDVSSPFSEVVPPPTSFVDANVQLPVVGVDSPSSADWKSPKSPNDSNDESSSEKDEPKVNASLVAAAESEKGPKPS